MDYTQELKIAQEAAAEAGKAIMEIYLKETMRVEYKEDNSPLTLADREADAIIVKSLRNAFPDYAILSEEEQDDRSRLDCERCFIVDPLDGTKEFIKRNGQFTVNIALAERGRSVMGVICVPVTGELYYAQKGKGAYRMLDGCESRLHVSESREGIRVVTSSSHGCREMDEMIARNGWKNLVSMGSSLKGCLIARGEAEVYYRHNPTMEWDTAAMQCIVEEAGGIFRQMDDSEMTYNREDSVNRKGFYILNCLENKAV